MARARTQIRPAYEAGPQAWSEEVRGFEVRDENGVADDERADFSPARCLRRLERSPRLRNASAMNCYLVLHARVPRDAPHSQLRHSKD